jgi:hypothetical protein
MVQGKKSVRVKFQALSGNTAGAVYFVRLVRAKGSIVNETFKAEINPNHYE